MRYCHCALHTDLLYKHITFQNYTQNIDTLETLAGVKRVLQCHGSFATATCLHCRRSVDGTEIEKEILGKVVPLCSVCKAEAEAKKPSASEKKVKKGRKTKKGRWDSDEEDESDSPDYPPWIMKVKLTFISTFPCPWCHQSYSPISRSSERSWAINSKIHSIKTEKRRTYSLSLELRSRLRLSLTYCVCFLALFPVGYLTSLTQRTYRTRYLRSGYLQCLVPFSDHHIDPD